MGNEEINKSEPEKYMQRNFVAGGNVERHNPLAPASSVVQLSTGGSRATIGSSAGLVPVPTKKYAVG